MLKFYVFLSLGLCATMSVADPCYRIHRSCLILKNQYEQPANISCNWLEGVSAPGGSEGSTQLDLSYGDGMGSPEPRRLYCSIRAGNLIRDFNFDNYYWGPLIEFKLLSEKQLDVTIKDVWGSQQTNYSFKW
ncbi:hypothetical protein [Legionella bononiensis]|uniref:Secreted protein n=1 Tax=Legionella bononiensis TaxID=2793102 RepID=A0ABS1W8U1_9GAMM|nr:hypothetical protein [Legionella bononiensis]MBL7479706.1 hypothetical protein [Legionella bononiensis]MBL7525782.1 hypothetical protein [Legionella bononiensis]MBL7561964.1 hypothetical protein [Legionella bononiensis]